MDKPETFKLTSACRNADGTVTITFKLSELLDDAEIAALDASEARRRKSVIERLANKIAHPRPAGYQHKPERTQKVTMSLDEYLAYWARDANGCYKGTEPEDGRREIWRRKLWAELKLLHYGPDVSAWTGGNVRPAGARGTAGIPWFLKKNGESDGSNEPMTMAGIAYAGAG